MEKFGRDSDEPGFRETLGDIADMGVDAKYFLEDENCWMLAGSCGASDVGVHSTAIRHRKSRFPGRNLVHAGPSGTQDIGKQTTILARAAHTKSDAPVARGVESAYDTKRGELHGKRARA